MSRQQKNRIRALVLLIVLSLNTVAGFACSVGVDMGYNTKHHEHQEADPHSRSKLHAHDAAHQHKHIPAYLQEASSAGFNSVETEDNCCANDVTSFIRLDKSVVENNRLLQTPVFLLIFTASYFLNSIDNAQTAIRPKFPYLRRWRSLNDTDIRIAIQSFQI